MSDEPAQGFVNSLQKCTVTSLYRIWAGYFFGLIIFAYLHEWLGFVLWLVLVPFGKWVHMRFFPRFSNWFGYGTVEDRQAVNTHIAPVTVTLYSALGCPFCPIVLRRLESLRESMGFTIENIDVSFRPQVLASRGINSVPVVEIGSRRLVGNATSEQLAHFIELSQLPLPQPAQ